jgi:hypothetical protein
MSTDVKKMSPVERIERAVLNTEEAATDKAAAHLLTWGASAAIKDLAEAYDRFGQRTPGWVLDSFLATDIVAAEVAIQFWLRVVELSSEHPTVNALMITEDGARQAAISEAKSLVNNWYGTSGNAFDEFQNRLKRQYASKMTQMFLADTTIREVL